MGGGSEQFIKLASSEMVRQVLQNHPLHQPAQTDDYFIQLLNRLSEAEQDDVKENTAHAAPCAVMKEGPYGK
jgi:hypothetical protein